jgi:hypothetical protein
MDFYRSQKILAGQNILSQSKNLIAFSASAKHFEPAQKQNMYIEWKLFLLGHKMYINFWSQHILGPIEGRGITTLNLPFYQLVL